MTKRLERDELYSLPDFLTSEAFTLVFGSIPGESENKRLTLQCKSIPIPGQTNEKIDTMLGGYQLRQSGTITNTGSFDVVFLETRDLAVSTRLRNWLQYVRSHKTQNSTGYKKDYSKTAELTIFDTAGVAVQTTKIYGVFPTAFPEVSFDSSSNAAVIELTVTFSFDYADYSEQADI